MSLPPFPQFCSEMLGLDASTRRAQLVIARALDGLPLDAEDLALFRAHTGREAPRQGGYPYALVVCGRQGGKTEQGAARLVYEATAAVLEGQRDVTCVGISQDHKAAQRVLFAYVQQFFERPLLRSLVLAMTADTITLDGGVRVLVLPCRPAAVRGLRCRCVVLDELAHFRSTENLPLDREAWRAALPTLLTTRGKVLALTSPYLSSGLAHELHRLHFGKDSDVLVWQSPSYVLHPGLDAAALQQIREVDPEGAQAEVEGEFLRHVSALLDDEVLTANVDEAVVVRSPVRGRRYRCVVDAATGAKATGDRWAVSLSHADGEGRAVQDALLLITPPFSPEHAAEQTAALCRSYGVTEVASDAFAQGFTDEAFRRNGLALSPTLPSKSELYLEFAAALNSGRVRLLDRAEALSELRGLERRRGATRDRVDHRPGSHDDAANVTAAAIVLALSDVARRCPVPGCDFEGCGGPSNPPLLLLFSPESARWERLHHPPAAQPSGEDHAACTRQEREAVWRVLARLAQACDDGDEEAFERAADAVERHVASVEADDPAAGARVRALVERVVTRAAEVLDGAGA